MVKWLEEEGNDEPKDSLPSLPGTYALVLGFSKRLEIVVGRLGVLEAQPGYYVYVGSALGPGGLAARVGRHCRHEKRLRWHVDYLRAVAQIEEVWYATGKSHRECRWASAYARCRGRPCPWRDSGPRTAAARPICASLLCRRPWPIFGRSCTTRGSSGCDWPMPRMLSAAVAGSAQRSRPDGTRR